MFTTDEVPYLQLHDVRFHLVVKLSRIRIIFGVKSVHSTKHNIIYHCALGVLQVSSYEKLNFILNVFVEPHLGFSSVHIRILKRPKFSNTGVCLYWFQASTFSLIVTKLYEGCSHCRSQNKFVFLYYNMRFKKCYH